MRISECELVEIGQEEFSAGFKLPLQFVLCHHLWIFNILSMDFGIAQVYEVAFMHDDAMGTYPMMDRYVKCKRNHITNNLFVVMFTTVDQTQE